MSVELLPITKDNILNVLRLQVAEVQQEFIMSNAMAIALCYVQKESIPLAVQYNDEIIGMVMYEKEVPNESYDIQILMIDEKYQGQGIGKATFEKLLDLLKSKNDCEKIILNYVPSNKGAERFYRSFGFLPNGEMFNNEIVMELKIN